MKGLFDIITPEVKGFLADTAIPYLIVIAANAFSLPETLNESIPVVVQVINSLGDVQIWVTRVFSMLVVIGVWRMQSKARTKIGNEISIQQREMAENRMSDKMASMVEEAVSKVLKNIEDKKPE